MVSQSGPFPFFLVQVGSEEWSSAVERACSGYIKILGGRFIVRAHGITIGPRNVAPAKGLSEDHTSSTSITVRSSLSILTVALLSVNLTVAHAEVLLVLEGLVAVTTRGFGV